MSRTEGTHEAYVKGNKIMLQKDRETGYIDIITAYPEDPIQTCTKNAPIRNRSQLTDNSAFVPGLLAEACWPHRCKVLSGTSRYIRMKRMSTENRQRAGKNCRLVGC